MGADEFHTHLYLTGDAVPGGGMTLKITDFPGTGPTGIFYSTQGLYDPPLPGPYGDWYLAPPQFFVYPMGTVPSPGGVLEIALRIPGASRRSSRFTCRP